MNSLPPFGRLDLSGCALARLGVCNSLTELPALPVVCVVVLKLGSVRIYVRTIRLAPLMGLFIGEPYTVISGCRPRLSPHMESVSGLISEPQSLLELS